MHTRLKHSVVLLVLFLIIASVVMAQDSTGSASIEWQYNTIDAPLSETGLDPNCAGKDAAFLPYAEHLAVHCDDEFMIIDALSVADHPMMVGITAWNEQVPLPQPLTGDNAWRIPLYPQLTGVNTPTVGQGPIAVAINGVMIFNPTRQDGVYSANADPYLIGELDECGGHSGRGDDYHYHIAPICIIEDLAAESDGTLPIAFAMDGFPIYGFTNPDGSVPTLDECNGQFDADGNYHYHATRDYPYVNGCFKGEFDQALQPAAPPIRNFQGEPVRVSILTLTQAEDGWISMIYEYQGHTYTLRYVETSATCFDFDYTDSHLASIGTASYCRDANQRPPQNDAPPPRN